MVSDDKNNGIDVTSSLATPTVHCLSSACPSAPTDSTTTAVPATSERDVVLTTCKTAIGVDGVDKGGTSLLANSQVTTADSPIANAIQNTPTNHITNVDPSTMEGSAATLASKIVVAVGSVHQREIPDSDKSWPPPQLLSLVLPLPAPTQLFPLMFFPLHLKLTW